MNDKDPMEGSQEERIAYQQQIKEMIQQDIEQRRQQRLAEFLQTREAPAVIEGATGGIDALVQSVN